MSCRPPSRLPPFVPPPPLHPLIFAIAVFRPGRPPREDPSRHLLLTPSSSPPLSSGWAARQEKTLAAASSLVFAPRSSLAAVIAFPIAAQQEAPPHPCHLQGDVASQDVSPTKLSATSSSHGLPSCRHLPGAACHVVVVFAPGQLRHCLKQGQAGTLQCRRRARALLLVVFLVASEILSNFGIDMNEGKAFPAALCSHLGYWGY